MDSKYLAFDIEIAKALPEGETDWNEHRPLGITCAAAISDDQTFLWHANDQGEFRPQMAPHQVRRMLGRLMALVEGGYTILTWNGLGFDFDVLAEESQMFDKCRELALNHVDMMFHFFCEKGYPVGLDAAAKGMGLPGKPKGMDGAQAPALWEQGEYHKVLHYVSQDVKNTLDLALAVEKAGQLNWTARSGRPNSWACSEWITVKEAMGLPEPDTSWMTDPWPRSKFYDWLTTEKKTPSLFDLDAPLELKTPAAHGEHDAVIVRKTNK